jgi:short chain dehydrogenase
MQERKQEEPIMKAFQGKVAVVTGAASGIGRALAERCAKEGMKVVLADIEEPALLQASRDLAAQGAQTLAVPTDVSQAGEVETLARKAFETYNEGEWYPMSNLQTANQQAFSLRTIRMRLLPTLIYAALVPYLIYRVGSERFHLSAVNALLLAAISPTCGSLIEFVRKRQLSVLGLLALVGIAAKVVSALLFHDARLVLISDSLLSGVYGLLLLGSVLIGKPVVVVLVTNMYAKSPEQRAQMEQRLQAPGLHRHVLVLTTMWGWGCCFCQRSACCSPTRSPLQRSF